LSALRRLLPLAFLALLPAWGPCADPPPPSANSLAASRALAFLVSTQNPDGSWGSPLGGHPEDIWPNPATHDAWRMATTGLCCMALMEHPAAPGAGKALDAGIEALLAGADLKRPSDWDADQTWGWIYALEALARAERDPALASRRGRIRILVDVLLGRLASTQSPIGGWAYYDFEGPVRSPSWATSFTTATAVLALHEARLSGHVVPPEVLREAVKAVAGCRLPDGAVSYSIHAVARPMPVREGIHNLKGSLSRIQVLNLATYLEGRGVAQKDLEHGLDLFFEHHRFLDVACGRPIPHEAYYQNAGYFYLFGHAYAGKVIRLLAPEARAKYADRLAQEVWKIQEPDGSCWDFPIHGYYKPYGTAFALLAVGPDTE